MTTALTRPPQTTARQDQILEFVRRFHREHGHPPTLREIGRALGIRSPNGVTCHLNALAKKGLLCRPEGYQSRGWMIPVPDGACPCCGRPMGETGATP